MLTRKPFQLVKTNFSFEPEISQGSNATPPAVGAKSQTTDLKVSLFLVRTYNSD